MNLELFGFQHGVREAQSLFNTYSLIIIEHHHFIICSFFVVSLCNHDSREEMLDDGHSIVIN